MIFFFRHNFAKVQTIIKLPQNLGPKGHTSPQDRIGTKCLDAGLIQSPAPLCADEHTCIAFD